MRSGCSRLGGVSNLLHSESSPRHLNQNLAAAVDLQRGVMSAGDNKVLKEREQPDNESTGRMLLSEGRLEVVRLNVVDGLVLANGGCGGRDEVCGDANGSGKRAHAQSKMTQAWC